MTSKVFSGAPIVVGFVCLMTLFTPSTGNGDSYIINFDEVRETCQSRYRNHEIPDCDSFNSAKNNPYRDTPIPSGSDETNKPVFCVVKTKIERFLSTKGEEIVDDEAATEKLSLMMERIEVEEKEILEAFVAKYGAEYYYSTGEIELAQTLVSTYGLRYCSGKDAVSTYESFANHEMVRGNYADELRLQFQAARIAAKARLQKEAAEITRSIEDRLSELPPEHEINVCKVFVMARPTLEPNQQNSYLETSNSGHPLSQFVEECE